MSQETQKDYLVEVMVRIPASILNRFEERIPRGRRSSIIRILIKDYLDEQDMLDKRKGELNGT